MMMLASLPVMAQEAGNNESKQEESTNVQSAQVPRIDEDTMGMLILARNLMMEKYDLDKNGRLSPEEREQIKKNTEEFKNKYIKEYDKDGDGKISEAEFDLLIKNWTEANPELAGKISLLIQSIRNSPRNTGNFEGRGRGIGNNDRQGRPNENGDRQGRRGPGRAEDGGASGRGPSDGASADRPRARFPMYRNILWSLQARDCQDPVLLAIAMAALEKYDTDKDGYLSKEEYGKFAEDAKASAEKRRSEMEKRRKEMLEKYDKDGDGKLSPEEMRAMRQDRASRRSE